MQSKGHAKNFHVGPGDCGSWVLNADNGDLCGHIVAGQASSTRVFFVTAEDIFKDISRSLQKTVTLPPPGGFDDLSTSRLSQGRNESYPARWWHRLCENLGSISKTFEIMSLGISGGSVILFSAGSFVLKDLAVKKDTVIRDPGNSMDCGTAIFNCSETFPQCSSAAGFDFQGLWKITADYCRQCPNGSWLFNPRSPSSNAAQNAGLSNDACEAVVGVGWKTYPSSDIW
jgi:hypothetical protein